MRPVRLAAQALLLACSVVGCEVGPSELQIGERPRLLQAEPVDGEGVDCDDDALECGVPSNRPLLFRFDRWLEPSSASRQSVGVAIAQSSAQVFAEPVYDVLRRQVTYQVPGGLTPGLAYVLTFADAESNAQGFGFVSLEGRSPDIRTLPPRVFRTTKPSARYEPRASATATCSDALAAFRDAGCTASSCHRRDEKQRTAGGLALDRREGLASMVGRVALATDRAPESGRVSVQPQRFGTNMALLAPREPAYSFLLYRMLLNKDAYRNEHGRVAVLPPSDSELEFAQTWFGVRGPMPPAERGFPSPISPVQLVSTIQKWIRDGVDLDRCTP